MVSFFSQKKVIAFIIGILVLVLFASIWYRQNIKDIDRYYFSSFLLQKNLPFLSSPLIKQTDSPLITQDYVVKSGDSLWNIAKKFGLNVDTIVSYNNPPKVHVIKYGSTLKIPTIDGLMHEKKNEPIDELARKYGIDTDKILFYNPNYQDLTRIFIPGALYNLSERMGKLGTELLKPLTRIYITALYGFRIHPITKKRTIHKGIDLGGAIGTPIYSAKGGRVIFTGKSQNYGNLVVIRHNKGFVTRYAHLNKIFVKNGQQVSAQMQIGTLGKTGRVTGPHLHFEVIKNGKHINPRDVTDFH